MHDVVIVGAGVAGCQLASILPKDLDIILLEKHKKVLPKDSGIVSKNFEKYVRGKGIIRTKVSEIECVSPSGKKFSLQEDMPFLDVLNREKFSFFMRKRAQKSATLRYEAAAEVISRSGCITVRTDSNEYDAKLVIGCDGAKSVVRSSLGIRQPNLAAGIMVKSKERMHGKIQVFFNKHYSPDFFSWIIPQSQEFGLVTCYRPAEYLKFFAQKRGLAGGKMYAHMIPMETTKSFANRALLVGDSCGQNKPLTCGGINYSLLCARIACSTINEALQSETYSAAFLSKYERAWKGELMHEIKKQMIVRKLYRKFSNSDIDKIFDEFGPKISDMRGFDYDMFSSHLGTLSKMKLLRIAISKGFFVF
jgi:flavin-dependent dehydrogenase